MVDDNLHPCAHGAWQRDSMHDMGSRRLLQTTAVTLTDVERRKGCAQTGAQAIRNKLLLSSFAELSSERANGANAMCASAAGTARGAFCGGHAVHGPGSGRQQKGQREAAGRDAAPGPGTGSRPGILLR